MSMLRHQDDPPLGPFVSPGRAEWPQPVELQGRLVRLGPLSPERDAADLFSATSGAEAERLWAYLTTGPFLDQAALAADFAAAAAAPDSVAFAIRDLASGRTVGRASYLRIKPAHRSIEVGSILFSPELQRRPAATEAMRLMAKHAFETLGYRRYEWKCDALNAPSRAAALRLGFRFEGVFAKHMIVKGRSRDTAWYAITDDEWPAIDAALAAWLDPTNFDAEGRQIRRLAELRGGR
jgi:RimJ/RimL family protein N-acetyltransferase